MATSPLSWEFTNPIGSLLLIDGKVYRNVEDYRAGKPIPDWELPIDLTGKSKAGNVGEPGKSKDAESSAG